MNQQLRLGALLLSIGVIAPACGASPGSQGHVDPNHQTAANAAENRVSNNQVPINQRFRNLDEYLRHLELMQGPVDGPWYKEIRPGVYELQTGNLKLDEGVAGPQRIFTREELERKFGFRN